jgi:hypothetical protein
VHGSGSSHNPVVYRQPPKVRDHRQPSDTMWVCGTPSGRGCWEPKGTGRDHRTPQPTQCYGDLC